MAGIVGHPVDWTDARIQETKEKLLQYIEDTEVPIAAEFAWKNKIWRQRLYDIPELADALLILATKKEAQIEKGALSGVIPPSMASLSLKQLGWKDTQDVNHSGSVTIIDDIPRK